MKTASSYVLKGINILGTVFLALGLLSLLTVGLINWQNPGQIQFRTVLTGSMRKSYPPESLLITIRTDPQSLTPGDVISFQKGESVVTHRIAAITPTGITTKGDSNVLMDSGQVSSQAVLGKVVLGIPKIGGLLLLLSTSSGRIAVIMTCLYGYLWRYFLRTLRSYLREKHELQASQT